MSKEIIDQIEKISGVESVKKVGERLVVILKSEPITKGVKDFLFKEAERRFSAGTKFMYNGKIRTVESGPHLIDSVKNLIFCGHTPKSEWIGEHSNPVIYDGGTWAEIIKSEPERLSLEKLIPGHIYKDVGPNDTRIIRFKCVVNSTDISLFSQISPDNFFYLNTPIYEPDELYETDNIEKERLIDAEERKGYFHK